MDNKTFTSYYNSAFPTSRFDISKTKEMRFRITFEDNGCFVRYVEALSSDDKGPKYILDFDGFAIDIEAQKYLATLDRLHDMILNEFQKTIKDPVLQYMRQKKG